MICSERNGEKGQRLFSSRHYSTLHTEANLVLEMGTDIMPILQIKKVRTEDYTNVLKFS